MPSPFHDKVALITGAASGVGLALAEALLEQGARLVMLTDRQAQALETETARLRGISLGRVLGHVCDVTRAAEVVAAVAELETRAGRIDLLFNNAGAAFAGAFEQQDDAAWAHAFALNFHGPLHGIRAVLPIMRRQGDGHVVNIVSGIAFAPMAYQSLYAATKAALNALTLALRTEFWDAGIRFTAATPGTTATAIWIRPDGSGGPPPEAQSPRQAAEAILAGVAENRRLVLGDARDARGAAHAFDPEAADAMDAYLLDVARRRRRGEQAT